VRKRVIAHRVLSRALQVALRQPARRHNAQPVAGPVRFLVMNLHEKGGSVRSNLLLASGLLQHHAVEVLSLLVDDEEAFYPLPSGVTSRFLDDRRPSVRMGWLQRCLSRLPSVLLHPDDRSWGTFNLWTDLQVVRALRRLDGGWLITTRPSLHLVAARFAPPGVIVIAREHDNFTVATPAVRQGLRDLSHGIDALSVLTHADKRDYEALIGSCGVHVFQASNALDALAGDPLEVRSNVVLAAGRLTRQKGFDLLIDAFAPVAEKHPEWSLRIFGDGPQQKKLRAQIDALDLTGSVQLLPATRQIGQEMAQAGVFVLSSRFEGFGRVVIEALSKALPVISFDCPRGPGEIITDGQDGLLVPAEDVEALTAAMLRVIEDDPLRRRLGVSGPPTAARYDLPAISSRWERQLAALIDARLR
jgi:glycosyltransferase involved in cell wall biosynthesis